MGGTAAAAGSAYNNPAIIEMLLPNFNATAYQSALQVPVDMAEEQVSALDGQNKVLGTTISAWQAIQNDVASVLANAQALEQTPPVGQSSVYGETSVSSSNDNAVTATSTNSVDAATGEYVIGPASGQTAIVLAQNEIVNSNSQASASTALNDAGSFSINGVSVAVTSTETLTELAAAINTAGAGVTAAIMTPPGGGNVLSLQATSAGPIAFSDPNGILAGLGVLSSTGTANIVQNYKYAQYSVNGVSVTQGTSNTDGTTIPGVSFTLTGTSGAVLTVGQSQSAVSGGVQALVGSVNQLLSDAEKYGGKNGPLEGSATLQTIVASVESAFGGLVPGQPAGYQSGSQVGITLTAPVTSPSDLTASVNTATLDQALSSNPGALASLLGGASGIATTLGNLANMFAGPAGTLGSKIADLKQQQATLQGEISNPDSPANQGVSFAEQQAQTEWTAMIQAMLAQKSDAGILTGLTGANAAGTSSGTSSTGG